MVVGEGRLKIIIISLLWGCNLLNLFEFKLTSTDIRILEVLKVEPSSLSSLTWICNCHRRTVQRSLKRLQDKDLIEVAYELARGEKVYKLIPRGD